MTKYRVSPFEQFLEICKFWNNNLMMNSLVKSSRNTIELLRIMDGIFFQLLFTQIERSTTPSDLSLREFILWGDSRKNVIILVKKRDFILHLS